MTKSLEMMNILRDWDSHPDAPLYDISSGKYPAVSTALYNLKALGYPLRVVLPLAQLLSISTDDKPYRVRAQLAYIIYAYEKNNPDYIVTPRYKITREDYWTAFGDDPPIWTNGNVYGPIIQHMAYDVVGPENKQWLDNHIVSFFNYEEFWDKLFWMNYPEPIVLEMPE